MTCLVTVKYSNILFQREPSINQAENRGDRTFEKWTIMTFLHLMNVDSIYVSRAAIQTEKETVATGW